MKKIIVMMILAASALGMKAATTAPAFPGGESALKSYLSENMQYPENPKELGIEGVVSVTFMVKADGSIGNIKIKSQIDPDLESEAIRLVKLMPKWTPADNDGVAVDEEVNLDINFSLE
ncbi:MAG: energy transducer TonB [Muribaculaceae bacterium]|nr:energy transducer TonB [Muribaculaceae bacterium]